ncbi:FAST kinase domain-containing protein 5, mitochondrial [Chionoecetes opilio]|uniref:FAST kinase domain-containing protein 5, mitochondrial n=1 Tax=Chionoecetes opilio TaxID=41210 RepID=A0A8J4XMQ3_CHIOP|nr:FAST kinase domain-containing protein 5, mitochondrial [Chionoecetes opilio]
MLSALSRLALRPKNAQLMKCGREAHIYLHTFPKSFCRSSYSLKPQKNVVEEESLSKKVLKYMRSKPEYAASLISLSDQFDFNSTVNTIGRHQLLLVVAHSLETKPNDILELFAQYASQKHNLTQDIIKRNSLMSIVKEKVFQAISLMTQDELKKFALIVKSLDFETSRYLIDIVAIIGRECGQRASEVDLEQCLQLFDILLLLHDNSIHKKKQFDTFMSLFELHITAAKPHHLVQILHYVGVAKKSKLNREFVQLLSNKLEEIFVDLSFIDAGIAVQGMFKCNVKLNKSSSLIKKTAKYLQLKAEWSEGLSDLESYAFVAMVKVIRAAKYHDKALLSSVSNFIMKSTADTLEPEVIAHVLALYANSHVYDSEIFAKLEYSILMHLTGSLQVIRVKDICRILWSFSHVGHKGSDGFLDIMEKVLLRCARMGELEFYPEHLSGSLFSLAVLEHYPQELIKEAFLPQKIEKLKGYQRSKQLSRLMALHQAVKIEVPEMNIILPETYINDVPKRTLSDEMRHRPALANLMNGANFINKSFIVGIEDKLFWAWTS